MKLGKLTSVGHNLADSFASGIGLLIGVYEMDVFGEAARTSEGFIEVDFLTGETSGGKPSVSLARACKLYSDALPGICERHGMPVASIRSLTVRFVGRPFFGTFIVTVEDESGRRSVDRYGGTPGKRMKVLDGLGRVRRK